METEFYKKLNPPQQNALRHFSGPALISAGPGTGKTRVLVGRLIYLIRDKNISPEHILAVTFTNKAANEIKERLNIFFAPEEILSKVSVCTFHSLGFSILKNYAEKTHRTKNFSIIDEADKKLILLSAGSKKQDLNAIAKAITHIKQTFTLPAESEDAKTRETFNLYEETLCRENAFDLDDLIFHTVKLFRDNPSILDFYRKKYQWIMIDEYQDINLIQYKLIQSLMPQENSNLCVIGDPNQAIYGFRGADVKFIKEFPDSYPGAKTYALTQSYRCSNCIIKAAGKIISLSGAAPQSLLQGLSEGIRIKLVETASDKSEAEFVARTIEQMIGGTGFFSMDSGITQGIAHEEINSLSDFAVLCRTKLQMPALEKAFKDHSIPYQTVRDIPFFKHPPARHVIELLQFSINPESKFIKDKLLKKKILAPSDLMLFKNIPPGKPVKDAIRTIINNYFSAESLKNKPAFEQLLDLAEGYKNDIEEFLKFTSLGTGADNYRPGTENVGLMTLHAAKGLEFKCVFIVGCEDGLLPYRLFENQPADLDEERRLLYVGMTRAKKFLFLSRSEKRFIFGKEQHPAASPYLNDIAQELRELLRSEHKKRERKKDKDKQLTWIFPA